MLHPVKPTQYQELLRRIVAFQQEVLQFACTTKSIDEPTVRSSFGEKRGQWFWERLYWQNEPTKLYEAMERLVAYVQVSPDSEQRLLAAFTNDVKFHLHFNDPDFQFHYNQAHYLDDEERQAVKQLMIDFYETLLKSTGFPSEIHHHMDQNGFKRDTLNEDFWHVNSDSLRVCPACDGQYPDRIRQKRDSEADHFFPKAKYPFLSIHPDNLIPICGSCNSTAKGVRDPIDDHTDAPLLNTFHPYHLPAREHIQLVFQQNEQVMIREKDGSLSRRVKNLNDLLSLEERWGDRIKNYKYLILKSYSRRSPSKNQLREALEHKLENKQQLKGLEADSFVRSQYLDYMLKNSNEFEELYQGIW